jgi:hypothetical protein
MKFIKGSDSRYYNIDMFVAISRETDRDYDSPGRNPTSTVIWGYLIKGEAVQIFRSSFLVEVDAFLVKHGIELLG